VKQSIRADEGVTPTSLTGQSLRADGDRAVAVGAVLCSAGAALCSVESSVSNNNSFL
jgi:hypothetical protein